MIEQSIVSIIILLVNVIIGIAIGIISFFLKRLVANIDKLNNNFHLLDKNFSKIEMMAEINSNNNTAQKTKLDLHEKELQAVWRNIDSLKAQNEQ